MLSSIITAILCTIIGFMLSIVTNNKLKDSLESCNE